MKALWLVSFRPIGKSEINDYYQSMFVTLHHLLFPEWISPGITVNPEASITESNASSL